MGKIISNFRYLGWIAIICPLAGSFQNLLYLMMLIG